jgi:hypothetical protein
MKMRGIKKWVTTITYIILALVALYYSLAWLSLGSVRDFVSMLLIVIMCLLNMAVFWPHNYIELRVTGEKGAVIPKGTIFKSADGNVTVVTKKEVTIK